MRPLSKLTGLGAPFLRMHLRPVPRTSRLLALASVIAAREIRAVCFMWLSALHFWPPAVRSGPRRNAATRMTITTVDALPDVPHSHIVSRPIRIATCEQRAYS